MLLLIMASSHAQEAYAVYTSASNTLTFFYDEYKATRTGIVYDIGDGTDDPAWEGTEVGEAVTKVVISDSFRNIRLRGGKSLFSFMKNLQSITGLQNLDTSEMTTMNGMFFYCRELKELDLSHFNTSKVTNMGQMFQDCCNLKMLDLTSFDTRNVKEMYTMFFNCEAMETIDLIGFNTENVKSFAAMFAYCKNLSTIYVSEEWSTRSATEYGKADLFTECANLVGGNGTHFDEDCTTASYACIDGGPSAPGYLTYKAPCLWVKGIQVDRYNKGDVLGDGKVRYNVGAKTLTLTDADITNGGDIIVSEMPGLTICFDGNNMLKSSDNCIWSNQCDLTLTGTGEVLMQSDKACVTATGFRLSINGGLQLTAEGGKYGDYAIGNQNTHGIMTVGGIFTQVWVFSPNNPITGFYGLILNDGQQITQPSDAVYDSDSYCLRKNGEAVTDQWVAIMASTETYNLWIGNTQVTKGNASNLTAAINAQGDPNIKATGTITFDTATNTLLLQDATIEMNAQVNKTVEDFPKLHAILNGEPYDQIIGSVTIQNAQNGIEGLKIIARGNCSLVSMRIGSTGIFTTGTTSIEADVLNITSEGNGIASYNDVYLNNNPMGAIVIEGPRCGIWLNTYKSKGTLHMEDGTLKLKCVQRCLQCPYEVAFRGTKDSWLFTPEDADIFLVSDNYLSHYIIGRYDNSQNMAFDITNEWVMLSRDPNAPPTNIVSMEESQKSNAGRHDNRMYNLQGQLVGDDYKGIVIVNGKKVKR